jgi:hypothetical protein
LTLVGRVQDTLFLFSSSSWQDSRIPKLRVTCMVIEITLLYHYPTYLWSADSCEAEGTVCPISFVKDVLVRTLTGHYTPSPSLLWTDVLSTITISWEFQSPPSSDSRVGFRYSDQSDQTLVLASAVAIFMYRCKRPKREEETSISSLLWVTCNCTSVAILQPSSQAFLIRHNKHLSLIIFACRRWEHSSGTRRATRYPAMQLAAS